MIFADIPGQENAKGRLRDMVRSGRLPHALLIHGPQGAGKLALARAMAQYLQCEHPTADEEPCGHCNACKLHASFNHLDMVYAFPVIKTEKMNTAPVADDYMEEWREFMKLTQGGLVADPDLWAAQLPKVTAKPRIYVTQVDDIMTKLRVTTHSSEYKVVLIWLPERMDEAPANKLLKILEEPFPDTVFLLVSNEPERLLPTIRSRCQMLEVGRLSDSDLATWLAKQPTIHPDDAPALAHVAEGSIILAGHLAQEADQAEQGSNLDWFMRLMRLAWQKRVAELKVWAEELHGAGRERQMKFYEFAQRMVRENFVLNFALPQISYLSRAEAAFSRNFARFVHERNAPALIQELEKARAEIDANANAKIVNFDLAMRVILLLKRK